MEKHCVDGMVTPTSIVGAKKNIFVKDKMVNVKAVSKNQASKSKKPGLSVLPNSVMNMSSNGRGGGNGITTPMTGMQITFNKTLDCQQYN